MKLGVAMRGRRNFAKTTRPFAAAAEDFTECFSRGSNLCVLLVGILAHHQFIDSATGDWLLVVMSSATLITFVYALGPVRTVTETRAFITHQAAAKHAAGLSAETIEAMLSDDLAKLSQADIDACNLQQQQRLFSRAVTVGMDLRQLNMTKLVLGADGPKQLRLPIVGTFQLSTLDLHGAGLGASGTNCGARALVSWLRFASRIVHCN